MTTYPHYPLNTPVGEASKALVAKGQHYYMPNYKPREMIIDRGQGARVWDMDGNDYIDLGAGIAVCGLGHQDPDLLAALDAQSRKIWHMSNIFFTRPPIDLAEAMVEATPFAKRAYFCNSGAEANEAAIKAVRKWAADQGKPVDAREIISFKGSFHGRTLASVTMTAQPKYHEGFEPLPGGFVYCDNFNDIEALKACVSERTAAIIVEPVQGEGGVTPATPVFLQQVRALCDAHNILLVVDEVQCGMGRTGRLFGYQHAGIEPDILTTAKALGGGLPIGAMLVGEKVEYTLQFGTHGSTFGGNPVMCAVALAALHKINTPALIDNVNARGAQLRYALHALNQRYALFAEVRGRGLMIGAELAAQHQGKAAEFSEICRRFGVLVLVAGANVLRFLPPLNITEQELSEAVQRMNAAVTYQLGLA